MSSARIASVGDAAVTDRCDPHLLPITGELVDHAKGADAERPQAPQPAAERVARVGLALEQAERLLDRVDQRPVELQQLAAQCAREDDARHGSARDTKRSELPPEILEVDRLFATQLG